MVVVKLDAAVVAGSAAGFLRTGTAAWHAVQKRRLLVGGRPDLEAFAGTLSLVLLRPAVQPPRLLLGWVPHAEPDASFLWIRGGGEAS